MCYAMVFYISSFAANCARPKAYLKNLSDLKSIKFPILHRHAEQLSTRASRTSLNYIILYYHHTVQVAICASGTRKKTTSASCRG